MQQLHYLLENLRYLYPPNFLQFKICLLINLNPKINLFFYKTFANWKKKASLYFDFIWKSFRTQYMFPLVFNQYEIINQSPSFVLRELDPFRVSAWILIKKTKSHQLTGFH